MYGSAEVPQEARHFAVTENEDSMRRTWALAAIVAVSLTFSSCAYDRTDSGDTGGNAPVSPTPTSPPALPGTPVLKMGPTTLGEVMVDEGGMTVYVYDKDEVGSGASSCRDTCLQSWPPVTSVTENPTVQGLQEVVIDTIPAADGTHQLTVNGRPVYRYKDDNEPGDAYGQAVGSVWWTLDSAGNPVTTTAGGE
ncbi:COG4315 family predicted lipoprotein [Rhodococcus koreensis]|uniref:Predicted lipoprotein with conserved Yx(FWY)xxD motif n=2 Tax=Rhodococcus TaxID=1827 RepID=A0A1H4UBR0_9NOCA|nr:hypothetical protein [Rhodococcus koreensis]SEC65818.1 Predicted lipoprotein with conserved Yx(FWY)xxD motif [Rhodococcus koreensis]